MCAFCCHVRLAAELTSHATVSRAQVHPPTLGLHPNNSDLNILSAELVLTVNISLMYNVHSTTCVQSYIANSGTLGIWYI